MGCRNVSKKGTVKRRGREKGNVSQSPMAAAKENVYKKNESWKIFVFQLFLLRDFLMAADAERRSSKRISLAWFGIFLVWIFLLARQFQS